MDYFHSLVREWFEGKFAAPTAAQEQGWPAIASGRHTLISAPTGSGKTLAAFLICIDRLLRAALARELPDHAQVVYVSPLKALSNDIHKNLAVPLKEIAELARERGEVFPEIRVAVRTGDTPASERQSTARKPPHIWITTPESLYILLTSESGRRGLAGVQTLILDEIHAVADDKRGSHLALSVERLCALVGHSITRIGLSATQNPIEEVARFLVGTSNIGADGTPSCTIVDVARRRTLDLHIELPNEELGPIAGQRVWEDTIARVGELAMQHRTTLLFVNTRRLVERVAHQLSGTIGEDAVVAHHGSLSRRTRLRAEERLKNAEVKICVATASLELGIDIGAVELVCQIGSPRSISVLLQRVGRSGHWLGGISKGRLFPLTRDELLECAALLYAVRRGEIDRVSIPPWPLDILAQQIVAMCSAEEWPVEQLFRIIRQAYPYRVLPRSAFDDVLGMLSDGVSTPLGYRGRYLHYDRTRGVVRPRRGARLSALTSGGAIPDSSDYDVVADPDGTYVGSVNEDFAVESLAGDVFLLGNTSWRIRRVERGKVRVEDAHGQAPSIPFWLGEAPARTRELSLAVSEIRQGIDARLADEQESVQWLIAEAGLSPPAAAQASAYIAEGKRILGAVPTVEHVVAERFFDESGGMQLVIHAPFGGRINKAWGLALRKRFCRRFDFELQASATDDGINLSLGPQHSFPLEEIFQFLHSRTAADALVQAVLASPLFTTRWRWTLTRSLVLLRFSGGKRVPAPLQRMRADDLLGAVFPAQTQCQDNRQTENVPVPDHPLVFEALRDCLTEALDIDGLIAVLQAIERGEVRLSAKDTPIASVFSHQILNAMPYAFLDNAPLEERRARAVTLRRALPERAEELGKLDPEAIRGATEDAWPAVRDADEMYDLLSGLIVLPKSELTRVPSEAPAWLEMLEGGHRVFKFTLSARDYWAAFENEALVQAILHRDDNGSAVRLVVRGWMDVMGPMTAQELAGILGFDSEDIKTSLAGLEAEGLVLRGSFRPAQAGEEFCNRRILARIHRATIAHLRREIEPVTAATFLRFLFAWQHLTSDSQLTGEHGLLEVVEQLQGFETAAGGWEAEIFPQRMQNYEPAILDGLCLAGDVVWGRWTRRTTQAEVPARRPGMSRTAALGLAVRQDVPLFLDRRLPEDEEALSVPARDILEFLKSRGASFFSEIALSTRHLPAEVEEGLWQLVAGGHVTADSFAALRSLISGDARRTQSSGRKRHRARMVREGRWSLLHPLAASVNVVEGRARQYLLRYGVLCRELLARESSAPPWRDLVGVLRRLEARGEIRGGRFVAGLSGEQFALSEAVDRLRALRRKESRGHFVRLSGCDPLNLVGIITPGARVAAVLGSRVIYRDGIPVAAIENGETRILAQVEPAERPSLERLLDERPTSAFRELSD